jgi:biopolymer transport protein ExbD
MAGGGSLGGGGKGKRGHSKRKTKHRKGFHIDMTPLVDITFLLLTFFMFTTTMATPQVMEMMLPPEVDTPIDVKCSELLNILIDDDDRVMWYYCDDVLEEITDTKKIREISFDYNLRDDIKNKLIIALKVSEHANYGLVVNILDELNLAEANIIEELTGTGEDRRRKFTIAKLTELDYEKIAEELPMESGQLESEEN